MREKKIKKYAIPVAGWLVGLGARWLASRLIQRAASRALVEGGKRLLTRAASSSVGRFVTSQAARTWAKRALTGYAAGKFVGKALDKFGSLLRGGGETVQLDTSRHQQFQDSEKGTDSTKPKESSQAIQPLSTEETRGDRYTQLSSVDDNPKSMAKEKTIETVAHGKNNLPETNVIPESTSKDYEKEGEKMMQSKISKQQLARLKNRVYRYSMLKQNILKKLGYNYEQLAVIRPTLFGIRTRYAQDKANLLKSLADILEKSGEEKPQLPKWMQYMKKLGESGKSATDTLGLGHSTLKPGLIGLGRAIKGIVGAITILFNKGFGKEFKDRKKIAKEFFLKNVTSGLGHMATGAFNLVASGLSSQPRYVKDTDAEKDYKSPTSLEDYWVGTEDQKKDNQGQQGSIALPKQDASIAIQTQGPGSSIAIPTESSKSTYSINKSKRLRYEQQVAPQTAQSQSQTTPSISIPKTPDYEKYLDYDPNQTLDFAENNPNKLHISKSDFYDALHSSIGAKTKEERINQFIAHLKQNTQRRNEYAQHENDIRNFLNEHGDVFFEGMNKSLQYFGGQEKNKNYRSLLIDLISGTHQRDNELHKRAMIDAGIHGIMKHFGDQNDNIRTIFSIRDDTNRLPQNHPDSFIKSIIEHRRAIMSKDPTYKAQLLKDIGNVIQNLLQKQQQQQQPQPQQQPPQQQGQQQQGQQPGQQAGQTTSTQTSTQQPTSTTSGQAGPTGKTTQDEETFYVLAKSFIGNIVKNVPSEKDKKEILRTIKDDKDLNESLEGMLKFIDSIASSTSKGKKVNISPEQRLNIAIRLIHGIKMYIEKGKNFLKNPEDLYKDIMTKTVNNYKGIRKGLYEISLEIIKSINKELGKKIEAYQDSDILVKEMLNYAARLASVLIQKPTGTGKATTQQAETTTTAKPAGSTTTTQPQTGGTTTSQTPTGQTTQQGGTVVNQVIKNIENKTIKDIERGSLSKEKLEETQEAIKNSTDQNVTSSFSNALDQMSTIAASTLGQGKVKKDDVSNITLKAILAIKDYIRSYITEHSLKNEETYIDFPEKIENNSFGIRDSLINVLLNAIKTTDKNITEGIESNKIHDTDLMKDFLMNATNVAIQLLRNEDKGGSATVQQQTQQVEAPTPPPEAQAQAPEPEDEEKEEAKETAIVKANEPQAAEEGATPSEAEEFTRSLIEKTNNLITRSEIAKYYAEKVEGKSFILDTYEKINERIQGLFKYHLNIDLNKEELEDIERNAKALTAAFFTQLSALDLITIQEIKEEIKNKEIKPEEAEERAKALLEERGGTLHAVWLKAKALKIPEPVSTQADKLIATITSIVIKKKGENSLKGATQEAESIRRFIITMQNFLRKVANETTEIAIKNIINPKRN